ncbi:MAG TPA: MoxR family ATPase, partial [Acidimicrobiales bacterium]|nr:MoxR family ATPase [Acidimicrobiales bacterium]
VKLSSAVETYILEIAQATRNEPALLLGAGPRASIALAKASRVMAAADSRSQVYPEDVKALLTPVIGHRVMLTPDAVLRGDSVTDILERVVGRIKPPMAAGTGSASGLDTGRDAADGGADGNDANGNGATAAPRRATTRRRPAAAGTR